MENWGLECGYCMMIGGEKQVVPHLDPILGALAPGIGDIPRTTGRKKPAGTAEQGYLHCGPNGADHFVKMVHNGIVYGLMAPYPEGLSVLRDANIGKLQFAGRVSGSGAGRWTITAAIDEGVPVPVLTTALYARFASRGAADFKTRRSRLCATGSAGIWTNPRNEKRPMNLPHCESISPQPDLFWEAVARHSAVGFHPISQPSPPAQSVGAARADRGPTGFSKTLSA